MPWANRSSPWSSNGYTSMPERLCAVLAYFTFGLSGLLYMLLAKRRDQSMLFRYHVVQASLVCIISWLFAMAVQPIQGILVSLLGLVYAPAALALNSGLDLIQAAVTFVVGIALIYGAIYAFLGKFAEVPLISRLVRANISRWG